MSRSKTTKDGRAGSCLECSKRKSGADKRPAPEVVLPIAVRCKGFGRVWKGSSVFTWFTELRHKRRWARTTVP